MSFLTIDSFDAEQLHVELGTQRTASGPKPTIKVSYGEGRRAIAFRTPPVVVEWPRLDGDGDYGTTFGPEDPSDAKFSVGLTDKAPPDGNTKDVARFFAVLKLIDERVVKLVCAEQGKLLKTAGLTELEVAAKMNKAVKPKLEDGALSHHRVNLSVKKFAPGGAQRVIKMRDALRNELSGPTAVKHGDVCMVAMQLDWAYTLSNGNFGLKYAPIEVLMVSRAQEGSAVSATDIWGDVAMPTYANMDVEPPVQRQSGFGFSTDEGGSVLAATYAAA